MQKHSYWNKIVEKYFSKLEILREGTCAIATLMLLKETFSFSVHLNCTLFFTICCKGFTICAKSGTNLHTKFIVPMTDCIPLLLWGKGIWDIASILSESIEIPFLEIIFPIIFASNTAKMFFLGFKDMSYFLQRSIFFQMKHMMLSFFRENNYVIQINYHTMAN